MGIWNFITVKRQLERAHQKIVELQTELTTVRQLHVCSINERIRLLEKLNSQFDLVAHIRRQQAFSAKTFGPLEPGPRLFGIIDHIQKELEEIRQDPTDLKEWVDVIILGIDGASRAGHSPEAIVKALEAKQTKNEGRTWPDWRTADPNKAIEHVRTEDELKVKAQEQT